MSAPPLGTLRYLYVGSGKFDDDMRYYHDGIGAEVVWNFKAFGARVAALRVSKGPLLLIADHRPAPSCMPVYEVDDLKSTVKSLRERGCRPADGPFEIPNGPCYLFKDPSGNSIAVFEDRRPHAMEGAFSDPKNRNAVREGPREQKGSR